MNELRDMRLSKAFDRVNTAARFRKPQFLAFDKLHQIIRMLGKDLPGMSPTELLERFNDIGIKGGDLPIELIFELATGVGKTRLKGAIATYLFLSGQTRNCLILAPRTAILDKLEREVDPTSSKYLFLDSGLISPPNVCLRSNLESFNPDPNGFNIYILSPQTITGTNRKFARSNDFAPALRDQLAALPDLVVLSDESHHLRDGAGERQSAWRAAIADLSPKLLLGFTATHPKTAKTRPLYSYSLQECLRDGLYTKAVRLWVENKPAAVSDDDWDRTIIDFGLQRLETKKRALADLVNRKPEVPYREPVLLIAAKDTAHADSIAHWLKERRDIGEDELLVAHSNQSNVDATIAKLVSIENENSKIKVVVNVFMLSEGWDVTNVWVVAPLRAMATFENAIQTMGRGLRLPAGRRTGDPEVDTLDVLCFGKEDFETIVRKATEEFGGGTDASAAISVKIRDGESPPPTKPVLVSVKGDIVIEIPEVHRAPVEPDLDFDPAFAKDISTHVAGFDLISGDRLSLDDEVVRHSFETVVRIASARVLADIKSLDPVRHGNAVRALISRVLEALGGRPGMEIATDPLKLALAVKAEIRTRLGQKQPIYVATSSTRKLQPVSYEANIPEEFDAVPDVSTIGEWR
ncbi:DEAD/DEAH box helicase [Microvirga sesbaniae]|uniref:DEAD/DEAH box helicase n=1 Tax=Microvirga sesbaniae TaxID=681392 RepID=UPI0021CAA766|nr:DEAD/DEAH box helicase family protein [Microvirga sp. HBU67692]